MIQDSLETSEKVDVSFVEVFVNLMNVLLTPVSVWMFSHSCDFLFSVGIMQHHLQTQQTLAENMVQIKPIFLLIGWQHERKGAKGCVDLWVIKLYANVRILEVQTSPPEHLRLRDVF